MQTLTTMELRKNLGHILDIVAETNESVTISRANKPLAVIISIAEYEEKVLNNKRGQRLETLSGSMDAGASVTARQPSGWMLYRQYVKAGIHDDRAQFHCCAEVDFCR